MTSSVITATYKIVVAGASGVGKTALVQRLIENNFNPESQSTVGVEFKSFILQLNDQTIKLQIWDTAGQERFKSVSRAYFRNAIGAILVYDISHELSFEAVSTWLTELQELCIPNAFILLVGNKSDLQSTRQVGEQQARDYAEQNHLEFIEASALNGENVLESFSRLANGIVNRVKNGQIQVNSIMTKSSPYQLVQDKQPTNENTTDQKCC